MRRSLTRWYLFVFGIVYCIVFNILIKISKKLSRIIQLLIKFSPNVGITISIVAEL